MARPPKKKIALDGGGNFGNPLSMALNGLVGLPEGAVSEPESTPITPTPTKTARPSVVLRKETARRGGKTVIVLYDFAPLPREDDLRKLAKILRNACGSGGAVKENEIEIQGDQAARVREILLENGYRVRGI